MVQILNIPRLWLRLSVGGEQTRSVKLPARQVLVSQTSLMRSAAIINLQEAEFWGFKRPPPLPDSSPIFFLEIFISECETHSLQLCIRGENPSRKGCVRHFFRCSSTRVFIVVFCCTSRQTSCVSTISQQFRPSSF